MGGPPGSRGGQGGLGDLGGFWGAPGMDKGGLPPPLSRGAPQGPPGGLCKVSGGLFTFLYLDLELKMGCGSVTHIRTFLDFDKYLKKNENGVERLFSRVRRCPGCQNDRLTE